MVMHSSRRQKKEMIMGIIQYLNVASYYPCGALALVFAHQHGFACYQIPPLL